MRKKAKSKRRGDVCFDGGRTTLWRLWVDTIHPYAGGLRTQSSAMVFGLFATLGAVAIAVGSSSDGEPHIATSVLRPASRRAEDDLAGTLKTAGERTEGL